MRKVLRTLMAVSISLPATIPAHATHAGSPVALTTFDVGLEGWTGNSQHSWQAAGGNPGGFARFVESFGDSGDLFAPPGYLGDWTALDGHGAIRFDQRVIEPGNQNELGYARILLFGPGGAAEWRGPYWPGTSTDWITFEAPIEECEWIVTSGDWPSLLADVATLRIRMDLHASLPGEPFETTGLDNIGLYSQRGCTADLNGDGVVDGLDLAFLLGSWGPCAPSAGPCAGDIATCRDGVVDGEDLGALLGMWGECTK